MKLAGMKGFYRTRKPDRHKIVDGKEVNVKGTWHRIYCTIASGADSVYVPVTEEDGVAMHHLSTLTLAHEVTNIAELPSQEVTFMRYNPDIDKTKPQDQEQTLIKGELVEHSGRLGRDILQVHIPVITEDKRKVSLRLGSFISKQDKGEK